MQKQQPSVIFGLVVCMSWYTSLIMVIRDSGEVRRGGLVRRGRGGASVGSSLN